MKCGIYPSQKRGNDKDIYYYVNWSPLAKADRWEINAKVPAIAGIYEIYWMDNEKRLRMFNVGITHYGGLRSEIRRLTDPELYKDAETRKILEDNEIWYRYAPCNSSANMSDVLWFLMGTYFPEDPKTEHSGRYRMIYITESEPNKLIWVP
jgi:hypothetical protein